MHPNGASNIVGQATGAAFCAQGGRILHHADVLLTSSPKYSTIDPEGPQKAGIIFDNQNWMLAPDPLKVGEVAAHNETLVDGYHGSDVVVNSSEFVNSL